MRIGLASPTDSFTGIDSCSAPLRLHLLITLLYLVKYTKAYHTRNLKHAPPARSWDRLALAQMPPHGLLSITCGLIYWGGYAQTFFCYL